MYIFFTKVGFFLFSLVSNVRSVPSLYEMHNIKSLATDRIFGVCRFVFYVDRLYKMYIAL